VIVWVTVKGLEEGLALAHRILGGLGISLVPQAAHAGLAMNWPNRHYFFRLCTWVF